MSRKKKRHGEKHAAGQPVTVNKKQRRHKKRKNVVGGAPLLPLESVRQPVEVALKKQNRALIEAATITPLAETTFSKKLEEVISETEIKKKLFGGKIILLGAPANLLFKKWNDFWKRFFVGIRKFEKFALAILLLSAMLMGLEVLFHNRVLPRITLAGEEYGLENIQEAQTRLLATLDQYEQAPMTFTYDDVTVEIPMTEAGIVLDKQNTLWRLPFFRLQDNGSWDIMMATIFTADLSPVFQTDDQKLWNAVENKLDLAKARAQNARVVRDEKKQLVVEPAEQGLIIDQSELKKALTERLETLSHEPIVVKTLTELPEVNAEDLAQTLPDLQLKLENQIALKSGEQTWKFRPLDHADILDFRKQNDQIIIAVSPELLDGYLQEEVFSVVEKPVSHLKIYYDDQDKIQFEGKALNGIEVNKMQFVSDLEMAINSLDQEVELPLETVLSELDIDTRLQDIGIKELLGTGHTAFAGSPTNRRHNISTGMSKFEGLLIKPGETFSFNDNLGEVDASTGYKLELVIKAEGTVPEYGGGICQVSSTFFKAALLSGLPIVERSPHSYAVSYYAQIDGYGLDSTIYPGVKDLRFTNDTPNTMLIQTVVDGDDAYVNFFGTSDGRQVRLENYWRGNYRGAGGTVLIPTTTLPPGARKQIESAHGGFDTSWDRIITRGDGQETVDKVTSTYRATSNRILVGQESAT